MKFIYPVTLAPQEDGVLATFPDFPEALTQGDDEAGALREAADCLEEVVAGRIVDREEITPPSPLQGRPGVPLSGLLAAKAALYLALEESGVTMAELARRLGVEHLQVRRLIDPRHRSGIDRIGEALAALGKRLVVEVKDAA